MDRNRCDERHNTAVEMVWTAMNLDQKRRVEKDFVVFCDVGSYYTYATPPYCTQCPIGKFGLLPNIHANESAACPYTTLTCPVGYYCMGVSRKAIPCPAGKYGNQSGLTSCYECQLGEYSIERSYNCTICPKGLILSE